MLVHLKQKIIAIILKHKPKQHASNTCPDDVCHPLDDHGQITHLDFNAVYIYNIPFILYKNITINHIHKRHVFLDIEDSLPFLLRIVVLSMVRRKKKC